MRTVFDLLSGYKVQKMTGVMDERAVLVRYPPPPSLTPDTWSRCIFLETAAGVPGFAAALIRHLHSLRRMERDHGWIHTLLEVHGA